MNPIMKQFLIGIAGSVIGAIIWFFLYRFIIKQIKHIPKGRIGIFLAILIAAAVTPLYLSLDSLISQLPISISRIIIVCALAIQLVFGYLLYNTIKIKQYGKEFFVYIRKQDPGEPRISVRRLIQEEKRSDQRLLLQWQTFIDGMQFLHDQIMGRKADLKHRIHDLCIGINHAGLIIASYLSGRICPERPIGYVFAQTVNDTCRITEQLLPSVKNINCILVVDDNLMGGNAIQEIRQLLQQKYGQKRDISIIVAVLVAAGIGKEDKIATLLELQEGSKGRVKNDRNLPHFVAFLSRNKALPP